MIQFRQLTRRLLAAAMDRGWPKGEVMQLQKHFAFISVGLIAAGTPVFAQTITLTRPGSYSIAFEAARPFFEDEEGVKLGTAAYFLSGHANLGSRTKLVLELPFAFARTDDDPRTASVIGNPYAGLQLLRGRSRIELGARFPSGDSNVTETDDGSQFFDGRATIIGVNAELERQEAFFIDFASLNASIRLDAGPPTGAGVALFGGTALLINTADTEFEDDDRYLVLLYGVEPAYRSDSFRVGARLLGRYNASIDGDFGQRSAHRIGLFAHFDAGRFRPGLHVQFPVDETFLDLRFVLGFNIQFAPNN